MEQKQKRRSKRHRTGRNNISSTAQVASAKDYGVYARGVHKAYRKKWGKDEEQTVKVAPGIKL